MATKYEDITKHQISGLKGIPPLNRQLSAAYLDDENENQDEQSLQIDKIPSSDEIWDYIKKSNRTNLYSPESISEPVGIKFMEAGYGDSKYDDEITNEYQLNDINEFRSEQLSGIALLANGIGKMVTTFGTTYISNVLGGLYGIAQGIKNATDDDETTSFIDGIWNNDIILAMSEVNDWAEKVMPNYYSNYELQLPWYKNLGSANFWGDHVIKNLGFLLGTAASMLTFSGVGEVLKVPQLLDRLGKFGKILGWAVNDALSSNGEASIEAFNAIKDSKKLLDKNTNIYYENRKSELARQFNDLIRNGHSYEEAKLYYDSKTKELDDNMQKYKDYQLQQLTDAGNIVWGLNMATLMITNSINLGSFIKGGYKNAKDIFSNTIVKIGEKTGVIKDFTKKEIALSILDGTIEFNAKEIEKKALKIGGRWVANMIDEGFQEGAQSEISTTALILTSSRMNKYAIDNNLTDAMINPETTDKYITYATAATKAYEQQFGKISSPGWEEVFVGALTGGLSIPGISTKYDVNDAGQLKKRYSIQWNGGLAEAIKDVNGDKEELQKLTAILNTRLSDERQKQIIRNAIGNMSIENAKDDAIEKDDIRRYKNNEISQAVNNALFYKELGLLDSYLEAYRMFARNVSDKDLEQLYQATYNKDLKGSPLPKEEADKVRLMYKDKAESTIKKIQNVIENEKNIREQFSDKFDSSHFNEAITELIYRKSLYDDTVRRLELLDNEYDELKDKNDMTSKIQRAEKKRGIRKLEKQRDELDEFIKMAYDNPEEYQKQIDNVREERRKYAIANDFNKSKEAYKEAKLFNDIAGIYYRSTPEIRDKVLAEVKNDNKDNKKIVNLIERFEKFKQDVDGLYTFLDSYYEDKYGDTSVTREQLKPLIEREQSMLDDMIVRLLNSRQDEISAPDLADLIQAQIDELSNRLQSKENGPLLFDENGEFLDISDPDQFFYLDEIRMTLQDLKEHLSEIDKVRKAGKPEKNSQSGLQESDSNDPTKKGEDPAVRKISEQHVDQINDDFGIRYNEEEVILGSSDSYSEWIKSSFKDYKKSQKQDALDSIEAINMIVTSDNYQAAIDFIASHPNVVLPENIYEMLKDAISEDVSRYTFLKKLQSEQKKEEKPEPKKATDQEVDAYFQRISDSKENYLNTTNTTLEEYGIITDDIDELKKLEKEYKDQLEQIVAELNDIRVSRIIPEGGFDSAVRKAGEMAVLEHKVNLISGKIKRLLDKLILQEPPHNDNENEEGNFRQSMKGNTFPMYYREGLKSHHSNEIESNTEIEFKQQIQDFIDNYISYLDKDTDVYYILDTLNPDIVYLGIKYSDIPELAKSKIQTVDTENGTFAIIGTFGYYSKSLRQKKQFEIVQSILNDQVYKSYLNKRWFASTLTNKIKYITPGYLINDNGTKSLNEMLKSDRYNPTGLKVDDLRFGIVKESAEMGIYIDYANSKRGDVFKEPKDMPVGAVYVYVKGADGKFIPVYLEPVRWKDWYDSNKDSYVAKTINEIIDNILKTKPSDESRRGLWADLYSYLIFSDGDRIVIGKDGSIIKYNSFEHERLLKILDSGQNFEQVKDAFMKAIYELNPRISVSLSELQKSPQVLIDSNILQVRDIGLLGVKGADFYVYPVDSNGNMDDTTLDSSENKTLRTLKPKDVRLHIWHNDSDTVEFTIDPNGDFYDSEHRLIDDSHDDYESMVDIYNIILNNIPMAFVKLEFVGNNIKPDEIYYYEIDGKVYEEKSRAFKLLNDKEKKDYFRVKQKYYEELAEAEKARKAEQDANPIDNPETDETNSEQPVDNSKKSSTFALESDVPRFGNRDFLKSMLVFETEDGKKDSRFLGWGIDYLQKNGFSEDDIDSMSKDDMIDMMIVVAGNNKLDLSSISTKQDLDNFLRCH